MNYSDIFDQSESMYIDKEMAKEIGLNYAVVYSGIEKAKEECGFDFDLLSMQDISYIQKKILPFFSTATVKRAITKLKGLGYIETDTITPEEAKEKVIKNKENTRYICEWCGCGCNVINKHHYPIPKIKGGTSVVKICPNCHYEFHSLYKEYGRKLKRNNL